MSNAVPSSLSSSLLGGAASSSPSSTSSSLPSSSSSAAASLEQRIADVARKIERVEADIAAAKKIVADGNADAQQDVRLLMQQLAGLQQEKAGLVQHAAALQQEKAALQQKDAALQEKENLQIQQQQQQQRKAREAHVVLVRLWNPGAGITDGVSAAAAAATASTALSADELQQLCAPKKLRVVSYADLCDKVEQQFFRTTAAAASADAGLNQQLAQLQLSQTAAAFSSSAIAVPASSSSSSTLSAASSAFTLLYLLDPANWWNRDFRVKVDDEDEFENYVHSNANYHLRPKLLVWNSPVDCDLPEHQQLTADQHRHSPLKGGTEPQYLQSLYLSGGGAAAVASPTKSNASSRSSAQQTDFAEAVRRRDDDKCVVCDDEHVEAAHVVPVKDQRTKAGLIAAELLTLYDVRNGITLCTHCHDYFDRGLWYISPDDRCSMHVSAALIAHRPVWTQRQGQQVRMPLHHADSWPTALMLKVQVDFFHARKQKRLDERKSYPFSCGACGSRFMTPGGFAHHGRYCTGRGHLQPSQFHTPGNTPAKAAPKGKQQQQLRQRNKNKRRSGQQQQRPNQQLRDGEDDTEERKQPSVTRAVTASSTSAAASATARARTGCRSHGTIHIIAVNFCCAFVFFSFAACAVLIHHAPQHAHTQRTWTTQS